MSDIVVSFIPTRSQDRVDDIAIPEIEAFLTNQYKGSMELQINRSHMKPFFIDAGGNHERFLCPGCQCEIVAAAWQAAMTTCWDESSNGFDLIKSQWPCCKGEFSPDQLVYEPIQGFAMVSFEITNPTSDAHDETLRYLRGVTSLDFHVITAKY